MSQLRKNVLDDFCCDASNDSNPTCLARGCSHVCLHHELPAALGVHTLQRIVATSLVKRCIAGQSGVLLRAVVHDDARTLLLQCALLENTRQFLGDAEREQVLTHLTMHDTLSTSELTRAKYLCGFNSVFDNARFCVQNSSIGYQCFRDRSLAHLTLGCTHWNGVAVELYIVDYTVRNVIAGSDIVVCVRDIVRDRVLGRVYLMTPHQYWSDNGMWTIRTDSANAQQCSIAHLNLNGTSVAMWLVSSSDIVAHGQAMAPPQSSWVPATGHLFRLHANPRYVQGTITVPSRYAAFAVALRNPHACYAFRFDGKTHVGSYMIGDNAVEFQIQFLIRNKRQKTDDDNNNNNNNNTVAETFTCTVACNLLVSMLEALCTESILSSEFSSTKSPFQRVIMHRNAFIQRERLTHEILECEVYYYRHNMTRSYMMEVTRQEMLSAEWGAADITSTAIGLQHSSMLLGTAPINQRGDVTLEQWLRVNNAQQQQQQQPQQQPSAPFVQLDVACAKETFSKPSPLPRKNFTHTTNASHTTGNDTSDAAAMCRASASVSVRVGDTTAACAGSALYSHPNSLLHHVLRLMPRCNDYRTSLSLITLLMIINRAAIIIALVVMGSYNFAHFTYISFLISAIGLCLIWLGLWMEGWLEAAVALVYIPMMFGAVMHVVIIITVVVALDPTVYIHGTICGSGSMTFNLVRTGDWILHGLPVLELFVLLVFDYKTYVGKTLTLFLDSVPWQWGLCYLSYFWASPLIPIGCYTLAHSPNKQYPNPMSHAEQTMFLLILNTIIQAYWLWSFAQRSSAPRRMPNFSKFCHRSDSAAGEPINTNGT